MKIEVGKSYKCGDGFAKIVYYEDNEYFGIECQYNGNIHSDRTNHSGSFNEFGCGFYDVNSNCLKHDLKKIDKEPKEVTMEQVCKKYGKLVKIVKGE